MAGPVSHSAGRELIICPIVGVMFVQVIHGKVADAAALQALGARWVDELGPGASGWLNSTSGGTADGDAVVVVSFESAEAARRNSDRPEQGAWWAEAEKCFAEPPSFYDFDDVIVVRGGVTPDAGIRAGDAGSGVRPGEGPGADPRLRRHGAATCGQICSAE